MIDTFGGSKHPRFQEIYYQKLYQISHILAHSLLRELFLLVAGVEYFAFASLEHVVEGFK